MAIPEGKNVFDVEGTVLYRVVERRQHEQELLGLGGEEHTATSLSAVGEQTAYLGTTTGRPLSGSMRKKAPFSGGGSASYGGAAASSVKKPPPRLSPLLTSSSPASLPIRSQTALKTTNAAGSPLLTSRAAAAAAAAATVMGRSHLTVESALDQLFPPQPVRADGTAVTVTATEGCEGKEDGQASGVAGAGGTGLLRRTQGVHTGNNAGGGGEADPTVGRQSPPPRGSMGRGGAGSVLAASAGEGRERWQSATQDCAGGDAMVASGGAGGGAVVGGLMGESQVMDVADGKGASEEEEYVRVAEHGRISRLDVVLLHQHLQRRCKEEHARPSGVVCTTREAIFNDGLKELTRQVTVLCPERGLLLDELCAGMAQSTETYDALFDSACQYAVRKSIERDLRSHLFEEKKQFESEVRRLDNRVNELRAKHEGMLRRFEERKAAGQKLHEEEIAYLKKANQQLVSEIKRLTALENANAK